ncbi:MAG: hypothetical protein ACYCQJ_16145 [Nitrososphaerales archaeon]
MQNARGLNEAEFSKWKHSKLSFSAYLREKMSEEREVKKIEGYLEKNKEVISISERDDKLSKIARLKRDSSFKVWTIEVIAS